jgi:hypothetical protein
MVSFYKLLLQNPTPSPNKSRTRTEQRPNKHRTRTEQTPDNDRTDAGQAVLRRPGDQYRRTAETAGIRFAAAAKTQPAHAAQAREDRESPGPSADHASENHRYLPARCCCLSLSCWDFPGNLRTLLRIAPYVLPLCCRFSQSQREKWQQRGNELATCCQFCCHFAMPRRVSSRYCVSVRETSGRPNRELPSRPSWLPGSISHTE